MTWPNGLPVCFPVAVRSSLHPSSPTAGPIFLGSHLPCRELLYLLCPAYYWLAPHDRSVEIRSVLNQHCHLCFRRCMLMSKVHGALALHVLQEMKLPEMWELYANPRHSLDRSEWHSWSADNPCVTAGKRSPPDPCDGFVGNGECE